MYNVVADMYIYKKEDCVGGVAARFNPVIGCFTMDYGCVGDLSVELHGDIVLDHKSHKVTFKSICFLFADYEELEMGSFSNLTNLERRHCIIIRRMLDECVSGLFGDQWTVHPFRSVDAHPTHHCDVRVE